MQKLHEKVTGEHIVPTYLLYNRKSVRLLHYRIFKKMYPYPPSIDSSKLLVSHFPFRSVSSDTHIWQFSNFGPGQQPVRTGNHTDVICKINANFHQLLCFLCKVCSTLSPPVSVPPTSSMQSIFSSAQGIVMGISPHTQTSEQHVAKGRLTHAPATLGAMIM